jgi:folate-binding Fe-S cluster repair protein YgfZ
MYDVFIHPSNVPNGADPAFLIECDARALPELHKHIARFVLRSKVKMTGVTEAFDVYSVLDDLPSQQVDSNSVLLPDSAAVMERLGKMKASIGLLDNRADNLLGYRAIVPKSQPRKRDKILLLL